MEDNQVLPWGISTEEYSVPDAYQRYISRRRTPPPHPDISPFAALLEIGSLHHEPFKLVGVEPSIVGYFSYYVGVVQYGCMGAQTGQNLFGFRNYINRIDIARRAYEEAIASVNALPGGFNCWVDVRDIWQMTHGCCPTKLLNLMLE